MTPVTATRKTRKRMINTLQTRDAAGRHPTGYVTGTHHDSGSTTCGAAGSFRAMRSFHVMRNFHAKAAVAVRTRPARPHGLHAKQPPATAAVAILTALRNSGPTSPRSSTRRWSDVKSKFDHVAVLHDVILALDLTARWPAPLDVRAPARRSAARGRTGPATARRCRASR
jgi:hypothetical protein